jgi:predicted transposase YbfD/YdcC
MITANIVTYLEMIPDPRTVRCTHWMTDIVAIALLAKICGADGWEDMHEFGCSRQEWLSTFLELPSGIPSPDTFRRVMRSVDPSAFLEAFLEWMKAVQAKAPGLISIDGKSICSAAKSDNPIHIVSAWCETNHMILGQIRNESKSNETAAIPELLKQLVLPVGCVITIDAAGTHKENAQLIRELAADYVLPVKGNQPKLRDELENFFDQAHDCGCDYAPLQGHTTEEKGHGRMEFRQIYVTGDIEWLPQRADWKDLRSLIKLVSVRWAEGKRGEEVRYFISSLPPDAERIAKTIRGHWQIENQCHWVLDVVFGEDQTTVTEGNAPENMRTINLLAAKMLKGEKTCKKGIRAKQFKAALDNGYLTKVLLAANF